MISVTFRAPTESDIDYLAENMREMDVRECRLVGGSSPREALAEGVKGSLWAYVAEIDGKPVCLFGVASDGLLGDEGAPWMLSVEGIERHARTLLVCAPRFVRSMTETFERLANVVHADNRSAIRFLKWCGFEFGEVLIFGGERFFVFEMTRERARKAA